MAALNAVRQRVTSGIDELDRLLNGLYIGDNVVWYDQAGSLASVFSLNLLRASQALGKPLIYVSFDRSPRNLLEKLGPLAENPFLTILDCFTFGKGDGSDIFLSFYKESGAEWPCRVIRVDEPRRSNATANALYGVHSSLEGDVRFIFESLTGMQELWGGEEHILNFYSHACPRLYELNTVAYWIIEKDAHSTRLRAQINQIAQVVIDLAIKRGKTSLAVLKAEKRSLDNLDRPYNYWTKDLAVSFEEEKGASGAIELGQRLKEARTKRNVSQSELAKMVGVTPSTISQIESNLIYPSLPALMKMAEVLSLKASSFFQEKGEVTKRIVFPAYDAREISLHEKAQAGVVVKGLAPMEPDARAEVYLVEIAPRRRLASHFCAHKGDEMGYVLSGRIHVTVDQVVHKLGQGDLIYLTTEIPSQWKNPGPAAAKLLWLTLR